jgi:hypothetical protein
MLPAGVAETILRLEVSSQKRLRNNTYVDSGVRSYFTVAELPQFTGCLWFSAKIRCMNIMAAAREHNRKAVQQNWHHFCDPTLSFTTSRYSQLIDIWRDKAGGRKMPSRSQLTARDLKDFLRDIVLFQREAENPSRYTWRLIGTGVTPILGHHTGRSFEESVPPEHLKRWTEVCDLILECEQPLRLRGRLHINGRDYLDAENLYLPLANDNDKPTYILGFCRYTPHVADENGWENELASIPGGLL